MAMYIKFHNSSGNHKTKPMHINCPFCGGLSNFEQVGTPFSTEYEPGKPFSISTQVCPNQKCKAVVVGVFENGILKNTYPGLGRPINTENVPPKIRAAFMESVACFSNSCFVASAIMIRKTLEEICADKGAVGKNLYAKIEDVFKKVSIPKELLDAMHQLRLLGNDAAHIEAEAYEKIGVEELELSIDFTQEIVKALYQYENLLNRLKGLKKTTPP